MRRVLTDLQVRMKQCIRNLQQWQIKRSTGEKHAGNASRIRFGLIYGTEGPRSLKNESAFQRIACSTKCLTATRMKLCRASPGPNWRISIFSRVLRFHLLDFGFKELLVALNPIEPVEPNFAGRLLGPIGASQFLVACRVFPCWILDSKNCL